MGVKVAVVILNFNTREFLERYLPSVIATQYDNLEIVLADNDSQDDSVEFVKKQYPQVTIIQLDKNYGFTGGYNRALKQVKADYYVLLNSDVEVEPNWISPMVELVNSNSEIAAVQPKLLAYHDKNAFEYAGAAGGFIDQFGFPFCRGRIFDSLENDKGQYEDSRQVFWASGAALFIHADTYHQIGGLDEDFFAHMEEIDLCWRLQNAGHQVWVCPKSIVYHVGGGTLQKTNPRKTYYNFRNGLILLLKNLPKGKILSIFMVRIFLDIVAAYRFLFQGKIGDFKAIASAHKDFIFRLGYWKSKRKVVNGNKAYFSAQVLKGSIVFRYFIKKCHQFEAVFNAKS
ncbi:MAG: glycosyltransferase family 2 protein [Bacteroidia bacterium]|nr:glycosyltransferase family 2 protein [Bacteroidia bacterium]